MKTRRYHIVYTKFFANVPRNGSLFLKKNRTNLFEHAFIPGKEILAEWAMVAEMTNVIINSASPVLASASVVVLHASLSFLCHVNTERILGPIAQNKRELLKSMHEKRSLQTGFEISYSEITKPNKKLSLADWYNQS